MLHPNSLVDFASMSPRSRRAFSKPSPEPSREPTREALNAALAERDEAIAQRAAIAEVLQVIKASPGNPAAVFEAILDAGQRLFGTDQIGVFTIGDDDMVRAAAWRGSLAEEVRRDVTPLADCVTGRVIRERRLHHVPDAVAVPNLSPRLRDLEERVGGSSLLFAPMLWEDRGLGSILIARSPPRPFSDREQALLQTFADQAAIAIENARLFNETKEALERQTATADILKVIAGSPTDVQPVFDAIATSANALIGGFSTAVLRYVGDTLHLAAFTPTNPTADEALVASFPRPLADFPPVELTCDGGTAAFTDTESEGVPAWDRELARLRGYHSMLFTPLMSNGAPIGMISVTRREPGPFAAHHVQLLRTFADQAVIAIENVRLFDEVQARTRDLTEALQQQTATADVLKVISRSAFDLQAVFDTLVRSAVELVGAAHGAIHIREGDVYRHKVSFGFNPELANFVRQNPFSAGRGTLAGRVALSGEVESIPDVLADDEFLPSMKALINARSLLGVPLLRDDRVEGMMILARNEPGEFAPRQIDLVRTFADQALIAIENTRLFDEVQARTRDLAEALQQQTATADVLKAIGRSAFDLQTVLDTLAASATALIGANFAVMYLRHGNSIRAEATFGCTPELVEFLAKNPQKPGRETAAGRVFLSGEVQNIPDALADPEYDYGAAPQLENFRALLGVPLFRDHKVEGSFTLGRAQPGPFSQARSKSSRPSPTRPSSRSRTSGCSTRSRRARAISRKRCSSRPRPPTC